MSPWSPSTHSDISIVACHECHYSKEQTNFALWSLILAPYFDYHWQIQTLMIQMVVDFPWIEVQILRKLLETTKCNWADYTRFFASETISILFEHHNRLCVAFSEHHAEIRYFLVSWSRLYSLWQVIHGFNAHKHILAVWFCLDEIDGISFVRLTIFLFWGNNTAIVCPSSGSKLPR